MNIIRGGYKSYPNGYKENFTDKKHEIVYDFLWKEANYVATKTCKVGQKLASVEHIVDEFEGMLSTRNVRTILKNLEKEGFITIEKKRSGNIVTIVDYKDRHSFTPLKESKKEWSKNKTTKGAKPKMSKYESMVYASDMKKAGRSIKVEEETKKNIMKKVRANEECKKEEFGKSLEPFLKDYSKEYLTAFFNHWTDFQDGDFMRMTIIVNSGKWSTEEKLKEFDYKP